MRSDNARRLVVRHRVTEEGRTNRWKQSRSEFITGDEPWMNGEFEKGYLGHLGYVSITICSGDIVTK